MKILTVGAPANVCKRRRYLGRVAHLWDGCERAAVRVFVYTFVNPVGYLSNWDVWDIF